MQKIYIIVLLVLGFCIILPKYAKAQECGDLIAQTTPYESRCAATGAIKIIASGGSGSYKYKVTGPVNINFTSADSITGLAAGLYSVIVNDIVSNCTYIVNNVSVAGSYKDPRFMLNALDVTCDNGNNGSISLNSQVFGRGPFSFSIIIPSPMGVGVTNTTGTFNNLIAGIYTVRLKDSCGGIQTRLVTINNYTWKIDSFSFKKVSCDSAKGSITVSDSRGNISTVGGISGFTYGIIRNIGDTIWSTNSTFSFYLAGKNSFEVIVKDPCGKIKKAPVTVNFKPGVGNSVNIYNITCGSFAAAITNVTNFINPLYCLYDSANIKITCNSTGVFSNLPYGNYCVKVKDSCSDTIVIRCFSKLAPPISVGANIIFSDRKCNTFNAAITGQSGLSNPNYCLLDEGGNVLVCNSTGVFNNLSYQRYCISIKDGCRDTTIIRCFNVIRPRPSIPAVIVPSYTYCPVFGVVITGDSLSRPRYCLFNSFNVLLYCNNTGRFDSIPYGNYCISVYDSCYDTTIVRCLSILAPIIYNDVVININNKNCASFTANVSSVSLVEPNYCLYNNAGDLLICNTTGIFTNLAYGTYCVQAKNKCPDSTFLHCFTVTPPLPNLNNNVVISSRTCNTFNANTSGAQNFTNPNYCLYNAANVKILCNTTGIFTNLAYGSYCIRIKDSCYDTLINRCFNILPNPIKLAVTSRKSCVLGFTRFAVNVRGGATPINIKVFNGAGILFFNRNYNSSVVTLDSIPGSAIGQRHKVVVTDFCGKKDSLLVTAVPNIFSKSATVTALCPSSNWANGSGTISTIASSNTTSLTVRIIKKNNVSLSTQMLPNNIFGNTYTFNNLEPATYLVSYKTNDFCNSFFYDTLTVKQYQYPNLNRSSAYQCDQNGFSIGAVVNNGAGPFTYEIIGSVPSSPSIITSTQPSPLFNINNGTNYSLIRLRVNDACGNASLGDASILPLANNGILASFNCFQLSTTLRVDTIFNAVYTWYQKRTFNNADSVFIGTGRTVFIPHVLPIDTGYYVCNVAVNGGCIKRRYYFHLNGRCADILPLSLQSLIGKYVGNKVLLNWKIATNLNLKNFVIERKDASGTFKEIGTQSIIPDTQLFNFVDQMPLADRNFYRIKMINHNNAFTYSNIVSLIRKSSTSFIKIYPNPATDNITIEFITANSYQYKVKLVNLLNQVVREIDYNGNTGKMLQINRSSDLNNGIYILRIFNKITNEEYSQKVILQ